MQYPITVNDVCTQQIQSIHPDIFAVAKFAYKATVNEDESVNILQVFEIYGGASFKLRITPSSEHDSAMERFLATIREHARAIAFAQHKAANKI